MKYSTLVGGVALVLALAASNHVAAAIDGTRNVVCAAQKVVACLDGATCMQGSTKEFDIPSFLFIDVKEKVVRSHKESGSGAASPIRNFDNTDNQVILQGVEEHRGWTLAIDRKNGEMSLTTVGADVDLLVFGVCTAI